MTSALNMRHLHRMCSGRRESEDMRTYCRTYPFTVIVSKEHKIKIEDEEIAIHTV